MKVKEGIVDAYDNPAPIPTRVILEGAMGEKFGREWNLCVHSPVHALRMINANEPGLDVWMRENADLYSHYHVVIEHDTGVMEEVSEETFAMNANIKSIRFVPLVEGAGDVARIVVGAALIVAALWTGGWSLSAMPWYGAAMFGMGTSLVIGGVVGLLTKTPTVNALKQDQGKTSYFFDGPTNTDGQGPPIALIYGRVLAGSNTVHASQSVEQLA